MFYGNSVKTRAFEIRVYLEFGTKQLKIIALKFYFFRTETVFIFSVSLIIVCIQWYKTYLTCT